MVIQNTCASKTIKKMGKNAWKAGCQLMCIFFLFFLVSPFSLHYADTPLEVSVESCVRTQMLRPTSNFNTENPTGFE